MSSAPARRYSSRHVPCVAERLAETMGQDQRFVGLMSHFKHSTNTLDERRHVVINTNWENEVPMQHMQVLQLEFQRRCNFGECYNLEQMTSAKFSRLLADCKVLGPADYNGQIRKATADILFKKVLFTREKGADRIGFNSFCTCLALVAIQLWPDAENGVAFASMIVKVVANSPDNLIEGKTVLEESLLDPVVILALDEYKPKLREMFQRYTMDARPNPTTGARGVGFFRCHEKTVEVQASKGTSSELSACSTQVGSSQPSPTASSAPELDYKVRRRSSTGSLRGGPVPTDRFSHMSLDQLLAMCRSLEIVPELLSGKEVLHVFHAAQGGARCGSSRHGLLSWEEFVDAVERIALTAYSRPPYSAMYPEASERVRGFLGTVMCIHPVERKPWDTHICC